MEVSNPSLLFYPCLCLSRLVLAPLCELCCPKKNGAATSSPSTTMLRLHGNTMPMKKTIGIACPLIGLVSNHRYFFLLAPSVTIPPCMDSSSRSIVAYSDVAGREWNRYFFFTQCSNKEYSTEMECVFTIELGNGNGTVRKKSDWTRFHWNESSPREAMRELG